MLLVLFTGAALGGSNPAVTFVLHAKSGFSGTCTSIVHPNCIINRPTVNLAANSDYRIFFYVNNVTSVAALQIAFEWDPSWDLLGSSWSCQVNQLTVAQPDPSGNGGPTAGTLVTAFDCVTGQTLLPIGYMDFRTGSSGCLWQVNSSYGRGIAEVVDCQNEVDLADASAEPLRFAKICVGNGGQDACTMPGQIPPICNAGGPYAGQVGVPVQFNGSTSQDLDGTIVAYTWSFGASGPTPTYTYGREGVYPVTLTVTDDDGASSTCETRVAVTPGTVEEPNSPQGDPDLQDLYLTESLPLFVGEESVPDSLPPDGQFSVQVRTPAGEPVAEAMVFIAPQDFGSIGPAPGNPNLPTVEGTVWTIRTDGAGKGVSPPIPPQYLGERFDLMIANGVSLSILRDLVLSSGSGWRLNLVVEIGE